MGSIEALSEVRLAGGHIPGCVGLVAEAHWNQTADDWRTMLDLGEGFGLVDARGTLVATSLALPYASGGFGWISMVLVTASRRRQGLATRLMEIAMRSLASQKLTAILDATPAGREVYRLLGFRDTWGIDRMQRLEARAPAPVPRRAIRPMTDADWPAVCALDARGFAADRSALLRALRTRLPGVALVSERGGRVDGFLLGRDGRLATQLGPCAAGDEPTAIALLGAALGVVSGTVFLDMPAQHAEVRAWLDASGFNVQRPYTRMLLGRSEPYNDAARMFAIAGPELG